MCGLLLLSAWLFLRNLMAKSGVLRAFYDPRRAGERQAYYRVLETLCKSSCMLLLPLAVALLAGLALPS